MINTSKFDVILDASDKNFVEDLKKAIGLKDGETLQISTPTFNRTDGRLVTYLPNTPQEYDAIKNLSPESLKKVGCQIWDKENGKTHWLYPCEWYEHIPDGTEVVSISGNTDIFFKEKTDDDRRYGVLAFGFIQ